MSLVERPSLNLKDQYAAELKRENPNASPHELGVMLGKRLRKEVLEQTHPIMEAKIAYMNTISPIYTFSSDMRHMIHVQYKPEDQARLDEFDRNIYDIQIQISGMRLF